jgi:cytochrome c oxidase subunit 2
MDFNWFNKIVFSDFGNFIRLGKMDASGPWQLSFSDPATPIMEGIINFHNDLMFFIVAITIFVLWMLVRCIMLFSAPTGNQVLDWKNQLGFLGSLAKKSNIRIKNSNINNESKHLLNSGQLYSEGINHHTPIEIAWTVTPALILMFIAVPSFALLYSIEEFIEPSLTVKCTGHQWYWCYEYSNCKNNELSRILDGYKFESYMVPTEDLSKGHLRLLEVDNRLALPINTHVQITVTAADVLHCWAVPALGIKVDACPGRLNQTSIFIKRPGTFYGQCSEICGVNHGFMPIVVRSENLDTYGMEMWFLRALEKLEDGLITFDGDALEGLERIIRIVENLRAYNPEFLDFITFNSIGDKVSYTFKPGNSQLEFEFFVFLYSQAVYKSSVIAEQEGREETYEDFIKGVSFVSEDYGCSTFNINVKFNDCATCV